MYLGLGSVIYPNGKSVESWLTYTCSHCNSQVSGHVVAACNNGARWLLCTSCGKPSSSYMTTIFPGVRFGPKIEGLPTDIELLYEEARNCTSVGAFTAVELVCRKILMNVAVQKGAGEGDSFRSYIEYLEKQNYLSSPSIKNLADLIKDHGNQSNHFIEAPDKDRAEATILFTAELLKLVYEMDHMTKKYLPKKKK